MSGRDFLDSISIASFVKSYLKYQNARNHSRFKQLLFNAENKKILEENPVVNYCANNFERIFSKNYAPKVEDFYILPDLSNEVRAIIAEEQVYVISKPMKLLYVRHERCDICFVIISIGKRFDHVLDELFSFKNSNKFVFFIIDEKEDNNEEKSSSSWERDAIEDDIKRLAMKYSVYFLVRYVGCISVENVLQTENFTDVESFFRKK